MPTPFQKMYPASDAAPDLVGRAISILARETGRLPATAIPGSGATSPIPDLAQVMSGAGPAAGLADLAGRVCPVTGAAVPLPGEIKAPVGDQAHDLLSGLLAKLGGGAGGPVPAQALGDDFRKQAHEFLETLLVTFYEATGEKGLPTEDKVPVIRCPAPVRAGSEARVTLTVANEEDTPSTVSLCWTNFISDTGHEIASLRISATPVAATIAAKGEAPFEITIAVPQQVAAGTYSGLIQPTGSTYVKAVLSVTVL